VIYKSATSILYPKNKSRAFFRYVSEKYQNKRRHFPEGPNFDTAREKAYFGRYIAGELEDVGSEVRKGIEVAQVREEL
jgi:hypothetical protein